MAARKQQVPVTTRALIQRINRALREDNEVVKASRGERALADLGAFYRLDYNRNAVIKTNVDLEALGRELGVLRDYEIWHADE